jgi:hypothetical protein
MSRIAASRSTTANYRRFRRHARVRGQSVVKDSIAKGGPEAD